MPMYYFHIVDNAGVIRDEEGMELPNIEAAHEQAEMDAREIVDHALRTHEALDGKRVEVSDAEGAVLAILWVLGLVH